MNALYSEDESKALRKSPENPYIKALYEDLLGEPNGEKSHKLLHTHFVPRGKFNELTDETFVTEVDENIKRRAIEAGTMRVKTPRASMQTREDLESARVLKLESEARRLQTELSDALETVSIMKSLFAKYVKNRSKTTVKPQQSHNKATIQLP